jgi:hypothetical protein
MIIYIVSSNIFIEMHRMLSIQRLRLEGFTIVIATSLSPANFGELTLVLTRNEEFHKVPASVLLQRGLSPIPLYD